MIKMFCKCFLLKYVFKIWTSCRPKEYITKIFPNYLLNFFKYFDSHIFTIVRKFMLCGWGSPHHLCKSSKFMPLAIIYIVRRIFVVCRIFRDIFSFLYSSADCQGDRYANLYLRVKDGNVVYNIIFYINFLLLLYYVKRTIYI